MKKRHMQLFLLLCSVLLLVTSLFYMGEQVVRSRCIARQKSWQLKEGKPYAVLSLPHHRKETISCWWNKDEEKYYLFLPSFWQEGQEIHFVVAGASSVKLDDAGAILKETTENRIIGLHSIEIDGQGTELEILRSEALPTIMIDMSEEQREYLYDIPYSEQYDLMVKLIDAEGQYEIEDIAKTFRVRGNTSADWVKKPYQLEMKKATDFLGMGSSMKWNLLSNWSDKTLIRNKIAYEMANEAGMPFSPESRFVDLYLNGDYQGCYQLCEKVEIGTNRVDIRDLEALTKYKKDTEEATALQEMYEEAYASGAELYELPGVSIEEEGFFYRGYDAEVETEDLTGGYLLEIERPSRIHDSVSWFVTRAGQPVTIKRPKYADEKETQYIAEYWQAFEAALWSEDGINQKSGQYYTDYIEFESFVNKYLVEEIVRNYDASSTSQYFYKDSDVTDSRIHAGPVWDYDMSLGNPIMNPHTNQHYISSVSPYGLFAALPMDEFTLWYHLYEKEDFRQAVRAQYKNVFLPILKQLETDKIDQYAAEVQKSALMDGIRWKRNEGTDELSRVQEYQQSVDELKDFLKIREYFLTGVWVEGKESRKVYLDGGDADMYISYVEGFAGDLLEVPLAPEKEGYTFVGWLNGYTGELYDFSQPYDGENLYFVAKYVSDADGSILIAGE